MDTSFGGAGSIAQLYIVRVPPRLPRLLAPRG